MSPFGVTFDRQIGPPGATFHARREAQPNVVITRRPDPLTPSSGRLASTARTLQQMKVFALFVIFQANVVISLRPAPCVHRNGFLAPTARTDLYKSYFFRLV